MFDSRGNQIRARYYDDSCAEIRADYRYVLDGEGRIGLIETHDSRGWIYHTIRYGYQFNRPTEYEMLDTDRALLSIDKRIFAYGLDGRTEERFFYDKTEARLNRRIVYSYDEKENLVDLVAYDSNASPVGRTSHAMDYDSAGNWIQRVSQTYQREERQTKH